MAGTERNRASRVAEAIKIELAELVAREVKDPRVREGLVTISHVEVNRDLSVAEVGVSILAGQPEAVLKGLRAAAGFLRGPLARRLRLRIAPDLRFHHDRSQVLASRLRDIVREDDERRAASGRDDEGEAGPEPDQAPPSSAEPADSEAERDADPGTDRGGDPDAERRG